MKFLPQLLLASALLSAVLCGRITPWGDPIMTNPNSKNITSMTLYFTLDNNLPAGHLLRVGFPFSAAPNVSSAAVKTGSTSISAVSTLYFANSTGFNSVYFYFASDLTKAVAYSMTINFGSSPQDSAGFLGWLQLETLSPADSIVASGTDTPITYDSNPAFAPVNIYASPSTSGTFSTTSSDTNAGTASSSYIRTFSIAPAANILFPATLIIWWDATATASTTSCTSVNSGITTNTTAFTSSQASCTLTATKMTVQLNQQWLANQTQTWSVSITNPSSSVTVNVWAQIQHKYNFNMTDFLTTTFSATLGSVTTPSVSSTKIFLSWGIDPQMTLNTANFTATHRNIFRIYGGASATYKQYQSMKFIFATSSTLATLSGSSSYTVGLGLCASATLCDVFESSISSGMTGATCVPIFGSSATSISCTGVTTIASSGNYIWARVWLDSTLITTSSGTGSVSDSTFGVISITGGVTVTSGTVDSGYKNAYAMPDLLVNLNGNGALAAIPASDSTSWATNARSQATYTLALATAAYKNVLGGVFGSTSAAAYSFLLLTKGLNTVFGASGTGIDAKSGFDLFMNPNIYTTPKGAISNCTLSNTPSGAGGFSTSTTQPLHCFSTSYSALYSRVRMVLTATNATNTTINYVNTPTPMTFFWDSAFNMTVYSGSSLLAGTASNDFYGAWYDWNANATITVAGTSSGGTDMGELGTTALLNSASDMVATANNVFFTQPILAPVATITSYGGASAKAWIASADVDTSTAATSNTGLQLIRIRAVFTSGTDPMPTSGKLAIFLKVPTAAAALIDALGPASSTYSNYASNLAFITAVGVRCFSNSGAQTCAQIRRPRAIPASAPQYVDFYQIITSDVNYTTSFTASIVIKPRHDWGANAVNYRLGFYSSSTSSVYIGGVDLTFAGTMTGSPLTLRNSAAACNLAGSGTYFVIGSSDTLNKSTSTSMSISPTTTTTFATITNAFGGAIYCVSWDFRATSFALSNSSIEGTTDKCYAFDYQSIDSTTQAWYCVFCPITQAVANTPTGVTLTNFMPPPYQTIPTASFYTIFNDVGFAVERSTCTSYAPGTGNNWLANNISNANSSGTFINVTGHKTTVYFTAPSTLKNVASITFNGKTVFATSDPAFPYATSGTDFQCRIVPSGSISTYSAYFTCTATITAPTITITLSTGATGWSTVSNGTTWAVILWGMLGSTTASALTANFTIQTLPSYSASLPIDQSTAIISWPVVAGTTTFTITNIAYQRPYANARGFIRWDFYLNSQRPFYAGDKLQFNIDAFINSTTNNLTNVVKCRVTDSTGALVQLFRSCTFNPTGFTVGSGSTATVTIAPLNSGGTTPNAALDFMVNTSSNPYRVYLHNLNTVAALSTIKTVYGTLYWNGNSSDASLTKASSATDFPTLTTVTSFPTNYPTLTKYWAAAGAYADLVFSIISSQATSDTNRIVIAFPSYYAIGLTTRTKFPYCTVNAVNVGCVVESERSLTIYGIGMTIAANTAIVIRVSGVAAPASYTVENFWLQIQSDKTDPGTVIYGGTVADTAYAAQTIATLHINWWIVSSSYTRTTATMTWYFTPLASADVATTQVVQVIFPEIWGVAYWTTAPTCTVTDSASSATYGKTQYMVGNILQVNLTTTLSKYAPCLLTCTGMRVPENDTSTEYQDIIIRTADANGTNIYLHSGFDNFNAYYSYAKSSSLTYVEWATPSTPTAPLVITRGTYLGYMSLWINGGTSAFTKAFMVNNANSNFAFYPTQFNVTAGTASGSAMTKLGASSSAPTGLYLLSFTITGDGSSTYTAPGSLWVNVTTSTITINPSVQTTITNYYVNSTLLTKSVPIMFDVTSYVPYSDITIIPVLGTGNTNFTVSPTSITLTPANPTGYFIFSTTATSTSTGSNYVNYTVNGTNAKAYTVGTQMQTLQITADTTNQSSVTPSVNVSTSSSDPGYATQKYLTFTLNNIQYATIYYVIGLPNQIATDLATIQNSTSSTYNINSQNQAQYGIVTQYGSTSANGISPAYVVISNLFPSTTYQINYYAISQFGLSSGLQTSTFTTVSNGGSITRWLFNFTNGSASQSQRQALLCTICSLVGAPYQFVRDSYGEICGNTSVFVPTTQTNTTGNWSILAVYFSPFPVNSDSSLATITSAMANNLTQLQAAVSAVATTPALNAVTYDLTAASATPTTTFPSTATTGTTYAYVSGLKLSDAGYIWIVLAANGTSTPTAASVKAGYSSNTTGYVGYSVQYYYPGGSTISNNFTGLSTGTSYVVIMFASNNDPSFLQYFSTVQSFTITTQGSSSTASVAMNLGTVSMFALALMAAMLALF